MTDRPEPASLPGRCCLLAAAVWVLGAWAAAAGPPPAGPVGPDHAGRMARGLDLFKRQVRPVLLQKCFKCHGGKSVEGELDLTDRPGLLRGGTSGPAIVPANAKASLLYQLVAHAREPHMPYQRSKLPGEAVEAIAAWIDSGAPYDRPLKGPADTALWTQKAVPEEARRFWSFQPLRRIDPPPVRDPAWVRTPVDRFIAAKLEAAGLEPNPPADRRHLIRRAYFDLLGLPPPPEAVDSFLADPAPDAYEKLLDRLLASPHYGERWGRHWLDLARFAESHGFEHDYDRPFAYHYRDFVIRALNDDLPYDRFVRWQLAGDEFVPDDPRALAATGFLAAGVHSTQITKNEVARQRYDEMDDMLATVGTSLLGLTVGCARCHDHKFDPIPQADYYRLLATFTTTVRSELDVDFDPAGYRRARASFDREHAPYAAAVKEYESRELPARRAERRRRWEARPDRYQWAALDCLTPGGLRLAALVRWSQTTDPEWRRLYLRAEQHLRQAPKPDVRKVLVASEGLPPVRLHTQGEDFFPATYFLRRGDPDQKEAVARQGFLQVLTDLPEKQRRWQAAPPKGWRTSYRRRALAEWVTDVDAGAGRLLARVIVNRLWQHHLGRGLVATPSEFGSRGERPTHPELLDWLAAELIRGGWRLKPIHKLIMASAVYRESAAFDEARGQKDRDNRLFWRRPRQRLEAEAIRDATLAVSGRLDATMFGPGTLDPGSRRRSIYFTVKRSNLIPMMQVFDAPDALQGVGDRPATTIAPQALLLMNNAHVRDSAKAFARRILPGPAAPLEAAVTAGYRGALARPPQPEELADALAFLGTQAASYQKAGRADARELALADFCQVLMCLNEFIYID
jgi:hypothetical protein